jgi:acylphosphatase
MTSLRVVITGQVQGVGYRDALKAQAERLGVSGWVRNRADGSVEAVLQGDFHVVQATLTWARHGPAPARVSEVRTSPLEPESDQVYSGFERRPTV